MFTTEYLTPEEAAGLLKVSTKTIIRRFCDREGVVDLGTPETRFKKRHRVLRIPRSSVESFLIECQVAK